MMGSYDYWSSTLQNYLKVTVTDVHDDEVEDQSYVFEIRARSGGRSKAKPTNKQTKDRALAKLLSGGGKGKIVMSKGHHKKAANAALKAALEMTGTDPNSEAGKAAVRHRLLLFVCVRAR